ncbi:MAG: serine/threonine-protein kinase [Planctomycetota bacterium]
MSTGQCGDGQPDSGQPGDDDLVADWIAQALAALDDDQPIDLRALCAARPDLEPQVAQALGLRDDLPALHAGSSAMHLPHNELLAGRYRLREPIGAGAAGTVCRAIDERLQRDVAVKLLHRDLLTSPETRARFQREAIALAAHEHPHIVRIHDQGQTDDGTTFLVTELLRGVSLHKVLDRSRRAMREGPSAAAFANAEWLAELLPNALLEHSYLRQVVCWIAELGEGLAAAHGDGVCHRDVKPSNAFVRDDGTAVLLDFGIATRVGEASITRTYSVVGTPCYMAPEQAGGRTEPHATLDVYGLGATLYHLLTLKPPHAGDLQDVLVALRSEEPIPAARLYRGLPRDLQAILDRSLERDPRRRYQTMAAMVQDLRAFLEHRPVAARPLGRGQRLWRRVVRRPARTLAAFAVMLVLVIGAIATPAWLAVSAHAAQRERAERLAHLPAELCIEGSPEQRALVPIGERTAVLDELDQLLDLDDRDVGVRLLRAAERLDAGRFADAHADLRAITKGHASPFLAALADRYAIPDIAADGRAVVDLEGLPEPVDTNDCFVAGFHALRARDCEHAFDLLSQAVDYLPARDLRLLAILGRKRADPELALAEAGWLEGTYGRATARTQHTFAVAMLQLRQYEAAIPHCEEALRLRPERHGPWNNLGLAHLRLGHLDEALRCYERAVALRPWFDNSLSGLCQTQRRLGHFDDARAAAQRMPDVGWSEYELGNVELVRAMAAVTQNDPDAQQLAGRAAVEHFAAAAAATITNNPKVASAPAGQRLAVALAENDLDAALVPFLADLRSDPRNARQIANLAALLAVTTIDDEARARLRLWLLDLAVDLAPGDVEFRQQRSNLLESLRSR